MDTKKIRNLKSSKGSGIDRDILHRPQFASELCRLTLAQFHHRYWLLFTAFVGINLLLSAFTKWCLMEGILAKLGIPRRSDWCCPLIKSGRTMLLQRSAKSRARWRGALDFQRKEGIKKSTRLYLALIFLFALCFTGCEDENYSKIVFIRGEPGSVWGNLYIIDYFGNDLVQLTDSGLDAYPRWSPEKDKIVEILYYSFFTRL